MAVQTALGSSSSKNYSVGRMLTVRVSATKKFITAMAMRATTTGQV